MPTLKVINYESFYRGETPNFVFVFSQPYVGFSWSSMLLDGAMTSNTSPTSNSDAGVVRLNETLTVDSSNNASYTMKPTVAESMALTPGATYYLQVKLKDSVTPANAVKPLTGKVIVAQDYVI